MRIKKFLLIPYLCIIACPLVAQTAGTLKWTFTTGGSISYSSPALAADGTVYVGSSDDKLYAVNPNGTKKWEYLTGGDVQSSPAVGADGTVYAGSKDKKLHAVNASGTKKWAFDTQGEITSSPAVGGDGTIYIGSADKKVYAVNQDGTKKWSYDVGTGYSGAGTPVVGPDGTVYVPETGTSLIALTSDGKLKWKYSGSVMRDGVAIGLDGTIYVSLSSSGPVALNPDGSKKWAYSTNCYSAPSIGADTTVYVGTSSYLYALSSKGSYKWYFSTASSVNSTPLVGSDGIIYFSAGYKVYAVNAKGEKQWEYQTGGYVYSSPALSKDGVLYVGSNDGKLYAVQTSSRGLAASPWPKFQQNERNAGSVFNNTYPVARIKKDATTVPLSQAFTLDGSLSADGNGGTLSYQWSVSSASSGKEQVTIASPGSAATQVTIRAPGRYTLMLKVWDAQNQASYDVIDLETGLAWTFTTGGSISYSSPALAADGTVYVGSSDDKLYAVNPNGTKKWEYLTGGDVQSSPAVGSDGTVYVGSKDKKLHAVNASGTKKWAFDTQGEVTSSPAVGGDGTIYIGSADKKVYAVNSDGTKKWSYDVGTGYSGAGTPVVGLDGTVYVPETGYSLIALTSDGKFKWKYSGSVWQNGVAIGLDGTIYVSLSSSSGPVTLNADGSKKWAYYTSCYSAPIIGADTTVYVGSSSGLYAISPKGSYKWSFSASSAYSTPAVGSDGIIYFGSNDNKIYAVNSKGEKQWEYLTGGYVYSSPALSKDGVLYVGSNDGKLYAVQTSSRGLAASPWPKFQQNERNAGSVFNNTYPVARIKKDATTVPLSQAFTLDGSLSADGNGGTLSYQWSVSSASSGKEQVTIASPGSAATQVTIRAPGRYTLMLKVWDAQNQASYDVIDLETGLAWTFTTGGSISYSSPALAADGTVYVGSSDDKLYAVNPNGTKKWEYLTGGDVQSSPAVGSDGTVYVGSKDKKLHAVNASGTKKWAFDTQGEVTSSPAVGGDGTIYIGSADKKVYAVNSDGTKKWSYDVGTGYSGAGTPVVGLDGTVYVPETGYSLIALTSDGKFKWKYSGSVWQNGVAIGLDGTIYVSLSSSSGPVALNADGSKKWAYYTSCYSAPIIGADTTVYVGSSSGLYAISPKGSYKWSFSASSAYSTPAVGSDGIIYFGSNDNKIYAVNSKGEKQWEYLTGGYVYSSPALSKDGVLYAGSNDGKLYAVQTSSRGLAASPWPKFQQNEQNKGQLNTVILASKIRFGFGTGQQAAAFAITNATPSVITLTAARFSHAAFSLTTVLPKTVPVGATDSIRVGIRLDSTAVYRASCEITYQSQGTDRKISQDLAAGLFLEDNSERTLVGRQAYGMYMKTLSKDPNSIATQNNLGVLYRLLGDIRQAETCIRWAYEQSMGKSYGYDGPSVNMGVVKSDENLPEEAKPYYRFATGHNSNTIAKKSYYNLAWEAYHQDSLELAATYVQETLVGSSANSFLMAKAYVLRGAVRFRQGQSSQAVQDFEKAKSLDANGPIGRMAEENIQLVKTGVSDEPELLPDEFALSPNYPNPFNPQTTIRFALPRPARVEVSVYNVSGQRVRTLVDGVWEAGWHEIEWDGRDSRRLQVGSGIYLLNMKSGDFRQVRKMTLMR